MRNKKIVAGALGIVVMIAAALPVYAENETTEINTSVDSTYTLTIPKKTDIIFNAESTDLTGTLKVTGNVLPTQSVVVTVETKDLYNSVQNTTLPYKLMNETEEFTTATWNEEELRSENKEFQLSVAIEKSEWNKAVAGSYEGSIVFTADMQAKTE